MGIMTESVVTFAEAGRAVERFARRPVSRIAVFKWATKGVRDVRLEHFRLGNRLFTSVEAVERFLTKLNPGAVRA